MEGSRGGDNSIQTAYCCGFRENDSFDSDVDSFSLLNVESCPGGISCVRPVVHNFFGFPSHINQLVLSALIGSR